MSLESLAARLAEFVGLALFNLQLGVLDVAKLYRELTAKIGHFCLLYTIVTYFLRL
jgi:hypothetical protein